MSDNGSFFMLLSIIAICVTWYKVSVGRKPEASSAKDLIFKFNGQPINGSIDLCVDGRTSSFKVVEGRIQ